MFSVNDKILVSNIGVCEVHEIETKDYGNGENQYYILYPLFENKTNKIMIPVNTKIYLRELVSIKEAEKIMNTFDEYEDFWLKDPRQRKEAFYAIINSGEISRFKSLYLTIQNKKLELLANKKMLNSTDKSILDTVTKVLAEEISVVLNEDYNEITRRLIEPFKVAK